MRRDAAGGEAQQSPGIRSFISVASDISVVRAALSTGKLIMGFASYYKKGQAASHTSLIGDEERLRVDLHHLRGRLQRVIARPRAGVLEEELIATILNHGFLHEHLIVE